MRTERQGHSAALRHRGAALFFDGSAKEKRSGPRAAPFARGGEDAASLAA